MGVEFREKSIERREREKRERERERETDSRRGGRASEALMDAESEGVCVRGLIPFDRFFDGKFLFSAKLRDLHYCSRTPDE